MHSTLQPGMHQWSNTPYRLYRGVWGVLAGFAFLAGALVAPREALAPWGTHLEAREAVLTWYCPCKRCCGPRAAGITASGEPAEAGITVASDWNVYPPGSVLDIDGVGIRVVQDTGRLIRGARLDVFVGSHREARRKGIRRTRVRVLWKGVN